MIWDSISKNRIILSTARIVGILCRMRPGWGEIS